MRWRIPKLSSCSRTLRSFRTSCRVLLLFALGGAALAAEPLPALDALTGDRTVSGVSSGGYMAIQFHVAHSASVKGVGALAAGPYYCAQGSLWIAYYRCMTPGTWTPLPSVSTLKDRAEALARSGDIDATGNLEAARVWFFSGGRDRTMYPQVVRSAAAFYEAFRANAAFVAHESAGHGMVTAGTGGVCGGSAPPFINDCGYDAAGQILRHLLGPLEAAAASADGRLSTFDQHPFTEESPLAVGMADTGYVYLPAACSTARCRVHVAFHGCRQDAAAVGEQFVRGAGYNRWADSNRLIVVYPQAAARSGWSFKAGNFVWNPRGCWDWWGYTGPRYHTREGVQIRAVKAMVERLSARRK
jgi:poly(3-hydroxybutyrate) depolymerase